MQGIHCKGLYFVGCGCKEVVLCLTYSNKPSPSLTRQVYNLFQDHGTGSLTLGVGGGCKVPLVQGTFGATGKQTDSRDTNIQTN